MGSAPWSTSRPPKDPGPEPKITPGCGVRDKNMEQESCSGTMVTGTLNIENDVPVLRVRAVRVGPLGILGRLNSES